MDSMRIECITLLAWRYSVLRPPEKKLKKTNLVAIYYCCPIALALLVMQHNSEMQRMFFYSPRYCKTSPVVRSP